MIDIASDKELDIPKPQQAKKMLPMILNTKVMPQAHKPTTIQTTLTSTVKKKITLDDINTNRVQKFHIEKQLATYLDLPEWCTFKDFTIGLLRFNKKVGDFYDRKEMKFRLDKYPFFQRFFPGVVELKSTHVKEYLLAHLE